MVLPLSGDLSGLVSQTNSMSSPREIVIFGPFSGESSEASERPFSSSSFNLGSGFG
jgi:hypothetical protein